MSTRATKPTSALKSLPAVAADTISDPAITFAVISDPLIFMSPEHLGLESMEHAGVMNGFVFAQAATVIPARLIASYIQINHPDFANSKYGKFMDDLPLRLSGYTHLSMGLFLAWHGQMREAAIAVPLGLGNLRLTGDMQAAINFVSPGRTPHETAGAAQSTNPLKIMSSAFKDANAQFATAQFAVLIVPMAAVAEAVAEGSAGISVAAQAIPAIPLLAATYFIGKNVINNERDNRLDPANITIHNAGYPTMLVGATAGAGGMAGLFTLWSEGTLGQSFSDLNSAGMNAVSSAASYMGANNFEPQTITDPQTGFIAATSCAALTICAAYMLLERRYGTFFKKGRPKKTIIPKDPAPAPE